MREIEERHELADANLACVLSQHVDELQPDRVAERLGDRRHSIGVLALHIRIDDGFATALSWRALLLRRKLEVNGHKSMYINLSDACQ